MKRGQGSVASALQHWVVETWIYEILLACALGAVIGYVARKTLKEAHKRKLVDHESLLVFSNPYFLRLLDYQVLICILLFIASHMGLDSPF